MTHSLEFRLNGQLVSGPAGGNLSLNEWIRLNTRVKSCKLACGEGGCGACAVALEYTDPVTGQPSIKSVNSCLTPAFAASGCQVTTAEGLPKSKDGGVNPVIDRLVGFHASQCGFCTPGMAIACHTALANAAKKCGKGGHSGCPSATQMRDALDGNLCRCTGYRPIVDACKSFASDVDMEDLGVSTYESFSRMPEPGFPGHSSSGASIAQPEVPPVEVVDLGNRQTLYVPHSLEQLSQVLREHSSSTVRLVAGNTGPGVYKDWPRQQAVLVSTLKVPELLRISHDPSPSSPSMRVGSSVTLSNLLSTLEELAGTGTHSPVEGVDAHTRSAMREVWQGLAAHLKRVAGTHVRNSATVVGNLVLARTRGLPSDVATIMLAAGASVEVIDFQGKGLGAPQTMPLLEFLGACRGAAGALPKDKHLSESLESGHALVTALLLPLSQCPAEPCFWSSRVAERWVNAASYINSAMSVDAAPGGAARVVFGMDFGTTLGRHQWQIVECPTVEAELRQAASSPSPTVSGIVRAALQALPKDLPSLYTTTTTTTSNASNSSSHSNSHSPAANGAATNSAHTISSQAVNGTAHTSDSTPSDVPSVSGACSNGLSNGGLANGVGYGPISNGVSRSDSGGGSSSSCDANGGSSNGVGVQANGEASGRGCQGGEGASAGHTHPSCTQFLRSVAEGLLLQGISALFGRDQASSNDSKLLAPKLPPPGVIQGSQDFPTPDPAFAPMTMPVGKTSSLAQATGTATFTDDLPAEAGSVYGAFVCARTCTGRVTSIDTTEAMKVPGAVRFVGPQDVPGHNLGVALTNIRGKVEEEPVFATDVQFYGEPVGMMLATTPSAAQQAAKLVHVQYEHPSEPPVLSIEQALARGSLFPLYKLMPFLKQGPLPESLMVSGGNLDEMFASSKNVVRGGMQRLPSQAHMYMEPQTAIAVPDEEGSMLVHSSTQCQDGVLATVSAALNVPHHKINVKCRRLGGGFGGKAAHASKVAAAAAVAAASSKLPVRMAVDRNTDLALFGGRCEVLVRYDVGFDDEGHIQAVDMVCVTQGGAYSSYSHFDAMGMASVADNVYAIPAFRAQYQHTRCNLPPRSTVRGPGDFPGILIMENIVEHVAAALQLRPEVVRERNFRPPTLTRSVPGCPAGLSNRSEKEGGDEKPAQPVTSTGKPYKLEHYTIPRIWQEIKQKSNYEARLAEVEAFNAQHQWRKRGLSIIPCAYHLSTGQKSALVHVYCDGSVGVLYPGAEMGQGLVVKVLQTAAYELSKALPESKRPMPLGLIRALDPSTHSFPHYSLTGGSTTSEQACEAVRLACRQLVERLNPTIKGLENQEYDWQSLITKVISPMAGASPRVVLTSHAHGGLAGGVGSYSVYGAAVTEAEVDALTGERRVISSDVLFDCGRTVNPAVDLGQVEGAFVFGMGLMLSEHMEHDHETGAVTSNSTWTYKVPGVTCVPERFSVSLLRDSPLHLEGPVSAKACGEPPLLLSSSVLFALQHASRAAAQQSFKQPPPTASTYTPMGVPATVQAVKAACGTRPLAELVAAKASPLSVGCSHESL